MALPGGLIVAGLVQFFRSITEHPLNRGRPAAAIGGIVKWQIGSRVLKTPAVVPLTDQARIIVRTGMHGATRNIYNGLDDFAEMSFTIHLLRPEDHFADVGANVGVYTVLAGAVAGARCVAFEPLAGPFASMRDNVAINGFAADLRQAAVGDAAGRIRFAECETDVVSHVATDGESGYEVDVVTLDDALETAPTLIKMDVEGYEGHVIEGAQKTLADRGLVAIIMEVNESGARYGRSDASLYQQMEAFGFAPFSYDPFTRTLIPAPKAKNAIFVRDRAFVEARVKAAPRFSVRGRQI